MLPETFSEQQLRIYCKIDDARSLEMLKRAFSDWCKKRDFPPPKVRNGAALWGMGFLAVLFHVQAELLHYPIMMAKALSEKLPCTRTGLACIHMYRKNSKIWDT